MKTIRSHSLDFLVVGKQLCLPLCLFVLLDHNVLLESISQLRVEILEFSQLGLQVDNLRPEFLDLVAQSLVLLLALLQDLLTKQRKGSDTSFLGDLQKDDSRP